MSTEYEDSTASRQRLYEQTKAELVTKQIANSTSYDTAILTLSSAFLALSVTFIKDVVAPLSNASYLLILYFSWCAFCLAIISTVASFMVGQRGIRKLIEGAHSFFILDDKSAYEASVKVANCIDRLNILNGLFFIAGAVLILGFTIINFDRIAKMPTPQTQAPSTEQRGQPTNPFHQVPAPASRPTPAPPAAPTSSPSERKAGS